MNPHIAKRLPGDWFARLKRRADDEGQLLLGACEHGVSLEIRCWDCERTEVSDG